MKIKIAGVARLLAAVVLLIVGCIDFAYCQVLSGTLDVNLLASDVTYQTRQVCIPADQALLKIVDVTFEASTVKPSVNTSVDPSNNCIHLNVAEFNRVSVCTDIPRVVFGNGLFGSPREIREKVCNSIPTPLIIHIKYLYLPLANTCETNQQLHVAIFYAERRQSDYKPLADALSRSCFQVTAGPLDFVSHVDPHNAGITYMIPGKNLQLRGEALYTKTEQNVIDVASTILPKAISDIHPPDSANAPGIVKGGVGSLPADLTIYLF